MTKWEILKKVIKPSNLIILIILLAANSFAWFIYATKVDNQMSAHVRAWKVVFEAGDSPITDYANVDISSMYPGMTEEVHEIVAYNRSEVAATLAFTIMEINIIGDYYQSAESMLEAGLTPGDDALTSAELLTKLLEDYPFTISISLDKTELAALDDQATYEIKVSWPYESGDDEADTYWGKKSTEYKETNPEKPSIEMKVRIVISQATE